MPKKTIPEPAAFADPTKVLHIFAVPGKSDERLLADNALDSVASAMSTARIFNKGTFGLQSVTDSFLEVGEQVNKAAHGDLTGQRAMLAGQAIALNAIFHEMARRCSINMNEYFEASERFMRLALKAQAQSRATIEALDRLTNGHEQTVKHVHVDNRGGQAIITDSVTTGGQENGKSAKQSHEPATNPAGSSPPLLSADSFGRGVPIACCEGQEAMQDARWDKSRRA
jgi:hypothetical protein